MVDWRIGSSEMLVGNQNRIPEQRQQTLPDIEYLRFQYFNSDGFVARFFRASTWSSLRLAFMRAIELCREHNHPLHEKSSDDA